MEVINYPYASKTTVKVEAGPGSGKTYTLLLKVHDLVSRGIVEPDEVLILSLTNKAVDNIISNLLGVFHSLNQGRRTSQELDELVGKIGVYTIHGLANRVVVENEGLINIIEENGWRGLMKLLPQDFWKKYNGGGRRYANVLSSREFEKLFREYQTSRTRVKDSTMEQVLEIMRNSKVLTNDDLIVHAAQYLETPNDVGQSLQFTRDLLGKYKVIIVDEFQDLFPALVPLLVRISVDRQLIMFGDVNQSVYGFLGSNRKVMSALEGMRPADKLITLKLYDNFRCTPEITEAAGHIIGKSLPQPTNDPALVVKPRSGLTPQVSRIQDPVDELEFVTDQICHLVCGSARLSDIAVLTRTNAQLKAVAEHLDAYGIRVEKLTSQPDWMADQRIRFLIDLLKVVSLVHDERKLAETAPLECKKRSDFSVIVTLSALHGVGNQSIQALYLECNRLGISLWDHLSKTPSSGWAARITNKKKIVNYINLLTPLVEDGSIHCLADPMAVLTKIGEVAHQMEYAPLASSTNEERSQLRGYLVEMLRTMKLCAINKPEDVTLLGWFLETYVDQSIVLHNHAASTHTDSGSLGAVKLSTIHSSKGLEFPIVFLLGGYNNMFPMEDNVLYVGMTRARNLLYLSNVTHGKLGTLATQNALPLLHNDSFWQYYNKDLRRPGSAGTASNWQKYNLLQKKYGLASGVRSYSTVPLLGKVARACRYLRR